MRKFEQKSESCRSIRNVAVVMGKQCSIPSQRAGSDSSCTALMCQGRACLQVNKAASFNDSLFNSGRHGTVAL